MVVGLLPTAGVKAEPEGQQVLEIASLSDGTFIPAGTKLSRNGAEPNMLLIFDDGNSPITLVENMEPFSVNDNYIFYRVFKDGTAGLKNYLLKKAYLVEFDLNGHGAIDVPNPMPIEANGYITPTDGLMFEGNSAVQGYTFGGWYLDENDFNNGTKAWKFEEDKVEGNIILHAKWTENTYTIVYHPCKPNENLTDVSPAETYNQVVSCNAETPFSLNANGFSRPGYIFEKWTTVVHDRERDYDDKGNVYEHFDGETVDFYANWIKIPDFTIKFNPGVDGVTGQMEDLVIDTPEEKEGKLPANKFVNIGCSFRGWQLVVDDIACTIADQADIKDLIQYLPLDDQKQMTSGTLTLYATWVIDENSKYKIIFDNNVPDDEVLVTTPFPTVAPLEGKYWKTEGQGIVPDDVVMPAGPSNYPDLRHYWFKYWTLKNQIKLIVVEDQGVGARPNNGTNGNELQTETTDQLIKYLPREDYNLRELFLSSEEIDESKDNDVTTFMITMKANWGSRVYNFRFKINNEEYTDKWTFTGYDIENVPYHDGTIPVPDIESETEHYKFAGWILDPDNTEGSVVIPANSIEDVVSAKSIVDKSDELEDIWNESDPTEEDPKWIDWEMNYDRVTEKEDEVKTIYLTALWVPKTYTVSFNNEKGENPDSQDVEYNGTVPEPTPEPTAFGYKFDGWCYNKETRSCWDFENDIVKDDVELDAVWTSNKYEINFVVNPDPEYYELNLTGDYTEDYITTVTYNSDLDDDVDGYILEDTTGHYVFKGWAFDENTLIAKYNTPFEPINFKTVVDDADVDGKIMPSDTVDGQITLYAVWAKKEYDINFIVNPDGKTDLAPKAPYAADFTKTAIYAPDYYDIEEEATFEPIDANGKYYFAGWAYEKNGKTEFVKVEDPDPLCLYDVVYIALKNYPECIIKGEIDDENDIITNDSINLYAVWKEKKYAIWTDGTTEYYKAEIDPSSNELPKYNGATPSKTGHDFTGWSDPQDDENGNKIFKPNFTPKSNGGGGYVAPNPPAPTKYTITWIDGNGNEIYSDEVAEGSTPVYDKAKHGTPTKTPTGYATYSFNNTWSPAITKVTGDQEYVAQFDMFGPEGGQENPTPTVTPTVTPTPTTTPAPAKPAEYDIEYYEELPDGTEVQLKKTNNPDKYTYGVGAEIKYGIDKEGYTFEGWYSKRSKKYVKKVGTKTKGTVKLYAIFVPDDSGKGNEGDNGKGLPTDFSTLFVRLIDYTENSMTLKWEKMEYVDGYDILGSRCNSKDVIRPYEPIVSVDADTDEYVMSDLLAKTYYKFYVRAFILVNGEKRYITTSINVHGVTLNDTYGVADELEIEKVVAKYINGKSKTKYVRSTAADDGEINITLKVGQSLKIVTSEYNRDGKEIRAHRPISFESSDPAICKIGKKSSHKYGVVVADKANTYKSHTITALAAGECDIYVFAQNGVYKTIHVTVK